MWGSFQYFQLLCDKFLNISPAGSQLTSLMSLNLPAGSWIHLLKQIWSLANPVSLLQLSEGSPGGAGSLLTGLSAERGQS